MSATTSASGTPRSSTDSTTPMAYATAAGYEIRCSRCHTAVLPRNAVQFGMNSYYCCRCADMVGYHR